MRQPGPHWDGSQSRPGLVHGCLYNLCTVFSSCLYVFCCCWLVEDCCMGRRTYGYDPPPPDIGPSYGYGSIDPPPPDIGPQYERQGLLGSIFGGPSPPDFGPRYQHQHHGLSGSIIGGPPGPPGPQSHHGPFGYPGEPGPPYGL